MKVLLVDDDPSIQRLYTKAFTAREHEVTVGQDGVEGVQLAAAEQPQIIMLDVMMPNGNGIDALKQLKASDATKQIPVIMLSANDDPTLMQSSLETGASRYVVKGNMEPLDIVQMAEEVAG